MTRPVIVCATSLAGGAEAFATLGDVTMLPESAIDARVLRGADLLITRSKVRVDDALLDGTSLRFYATATAGTDHMDLASLARHGVAWAAAPGSNAGSVAEHVIATLAWLGQRNGKDWAGKTLAVIGCGHVGSRLAKLAHALGMSVRLNDPPLQEKTGRPDLEGRRDVLANADVVTLHTPLTLDGPWPTRGMVDETFLGEMKSGAVLINTARGEIIDEATVVEAVNTNFLSALVLDVFPDEPDISPALLNATTLATPHLAGYALDARLRGTAMVYEAACRHLGVTPTWTPPADTAREILPSDTLYRLILAACDPGQDDRRLRESPADGESMRKHFQRVRQTSRERREFAHYAIRDATPGVASTALQLGFSLY